MKISTPTKNQLYSLTRKMNRIRIYQPIFPFSGTGVRGFSKFMSYKEKRLKAINDEYNLLMAGLIEIVETGESAEYILTKDGALLALIDKMSREPKQLNDMESCIVLFDIPEDVRRFRDKFRNALKQIGFEQLQQSVWQIKKDVINDMNYLIEILGIQKWTKVRKSIS